ncbi:MAG: exo-alpha-sialidase [Clostridia bacterium]|nr:exo-alpha-sialidase [Clostridia bacterium]
MKKNTGRQVLFMGADGTTPRNGEGTFISLNDGRIMFVYSRFSGETWADDSVADIAALFSADEGETWSEPEIIFTHDENADNYMCPSLFRMTDGNIGILYLRKDKATINAVPFFSHSDDEGKTWSTPEKITDDDENYYVIENDHAVVLSDGRIILPANFHTGTVNGRKEIIEHGLKCIFASDDNGRTWREIAERQDIPFADISETGLQETCVYQHSDGTLTAYSRTDLAFQFRCTSEDNGKTWTSPVPARFFSSPDSPLLMKRACGYTLAVFNPIPNYTTRSCENTWGRTPLMCAVSKDDGRTFPIILTLESDPNNGYCYPAIFDGGDYALISYYHSDNTGTPLTATKIIKITADELEDWFVTFTGGFSNRKKGKNAKKIAVDKTFERLDRAWYIPAVYLCPKGIIADILIGTEPEMIKDFFDKWAYFSCREDSLTQEQLRELERENPLDISFRATLCVNGRKLGRSFGSAINFIPQALLPDGGENSEETLKVMNHYGLDKNKAWTMHRMSFPYTVTKKTVIKSLSIEFAEEHERVYGEKFTCGNNGKVKIINPVDSTEHELTALEITEEALSIPDFDGMKLPSHYRQMIFSLEPDCKDFALTDTVPNDEPIPCNSDDSTHDTSASSIAIIGGADGPTAVFMTGMAKENHHTACSSLRHNLTEHTVWQSVFRRKTADKLYIKLID